MPDKQPVEGPSFTLVAWTAMNAPGWSYRHIMEDGDDPFRTVCGMRSLLNAGYVERVRIPVASITSYYRDSFGSCGIRTGAGPSYSACGTCMRRSGMAEIIEKALAKKESPKKEEAPKPHVEIPNASTGASTFPTSTRLERLVLSWVWRGRGD